MVFDIVRNGLSLMVPNVVLPLVYRNRKPIGCPEELSYSGACIRSSEVECLGGMIYKTYC
jgi:hypothetical protein